MRQGGSREGGEESNPHSSTGSQRLPSIGSSLGNAKDGRFSSTWPREGAFTPQALGAGPLAWASCPQAPLQALARGWPGGRSLLQLLPPLVRGPPSPGRGGCQHSAGGRPQAGRREKWEFKKSHRLGSWATSRFPTDVPALGLGAPPAPECAPLTQRLPAGPWPGVSAVPAGLDRMPPALGTQGQVTGPEFMGFTGSGWAGPPQRRAVPSSTVHGTARSRRGAVPRLPAPPCPPRRVLPPRPPRAQEPAPPGRCVLSSGCHDDARDQASLQSQEAGARSGGDRAGFHGGWEGGPARPRPSGWGPRALPSCAGSV